MESVRHSHMSNPSKRSDLSHHCNPQTRKQDQSYRENFRVESRKQAFPVTFASWWRLWIITGRIGLRLNSTAKWLGVLKLVWVGILAVARRDIVREVSTFLQLVSLIRGDLDLRFPHPIACCEATKDIEGSELHEDPAFCKTHEKTSSAWDMELFKDRKFQDREFFTIKESLKIDRDDLDYFLEPNPSMVPSWKVECIRKFCSIHTGPNLETEASSNCPDKFFARAWVDSRVRRHGPLEVKTDTFRASTLYEILKETVSSALISAHHT
jgi:hypothetical protein